MAMKSGTRARSQKSGPTDSQKRKFLRAYRALNKSTESTE